MKRRECISSRYIYIYIYIYIESRLLVVVAVVVALALVVAVPVALALAGLPSPLDPRTGNPVRVSERRVYLGEIELDSDMLKCTYTRFKKDPV